MTLWPFDPRVTHLTFPPDPSPLLVYRTLRLAASTLPPTARWNTQEVWPIDDRMSAPSDRKCIKSSGIVFCHVGPVCTGHLCQPCFVRHELQRGMLIAIHLVSLWLHVMCEWDCVSPGFTFYICWRIVSVDPTWPHTSMDLGRLYVYMH